MGQGEVINLLRRVNRPLTSTEIAQMLNTGARSVRRILKDLQKDKTINISFKKLTPNQKKKRYGKAIGVPKIGIYVLKRC